MKIFILLQMYIYPKILQSSFVTAVNVKKLTGKAVTVLDNKSWLNLHKWLAAKLPLNKEKPRRVRGSLAHKAESFRLDLIFTHGTHHIRKPFGTVAKAKPAAEFQQSRCSAAHISYVAKYLVPRNSLCLTHALDTRICGFVRRIAGNNVKTAFRAGVTQSL
jgi:hypothetical protein